MGNGTDYSPRNARKPINKGIGQCPKCGRGRALVSVKPRPFTPGETTSYCRWDDCDYARVIPEPADPSPSAAESASDQPGSTGTGNQPNRTQEEEL